MSTENSISANQPSFIQEFCIFLDHLKKHTESFPTKNESRGMDELYSFLLQEAFVETYWEELGPPGPRGAQGLIVFVKNAANLSQELLALDGSENQETTAFSPQRFAQSLEVIPHYVRYWKSLLAQENETNEVSEEVSVEEEEESPSRAISARLFESMKETLDLMKSHDAAFLGKMETLVRSFDEGSTNREQKALKRQTDILQILREMETQRYSVLERIIFPLDRQLIQAKKDLQRLMAQKQHEKLPAFIEIALTGLENRLKDSLAAQGIFLDNEVCEGAVFDENKAIVHSVEWVDDVQKDRMIKEIGSHAFYRVVEGEREYLHMADVVTYSIKEKEEEE